MAAAAQFAYLDTRVSAMKGRLLSDAAVAGLIGAAVEERGAALRRAGLAPTLADAGPRALEQAIVGILVREAQALARPLTGPARAVVNYWMRRLELLNLKAIVRGLAAGLDPDSLRDGLLDLGGMTALPLDAAVHADDVAELLRRLEDSPYADMARRARALYEEQRDVFGVEAALDRDYFRGLAERANALPAAAGRDLRRLVGVFIDQMNLVWLLRYRHVMGLEPAHTYYLLIPAGRRLDSRRLLQLVQLETVDDVLQALPDALGALMSGVHDVEQAEAAMRRETARVARCVLGLTAFNAARPCAYLLLREWRLWQIYGIVEGARLDLPREVVAAAVGVPSAAAPGR